MAMTVRSLRLKALCVALFSFLAVFLAGSEKKVLTFNDVMRFKSITGSIISEDGRWLVYAARPDRGNGEVVIRQTEGDVEYRIQEGTKPDLSRDGQWLAVFIEPRAEEVDPQAKDKPKTGLGVLKTKDGTLRQYKDVKSFHFSKDSRWLVFHHYPEIKNGGDEGEETAENTLEKTGEKKTVDGDKGSLLVLRDLRSARDLTINGVLSYALDPDSRYLACTTVTDGNSQTLCVIPLDRETGDRIQLRPSGSGSYLHLTWSKSGSILAFLQKPIATKTDGLPDSCVLWCWDGTTHRLMELMGRKHLPEGWMIPGENSLTWNETGERLFFGLKPVEETVFYREKQSEKQTEKEKDTYYDIDAIVNKRALDIWHWQDALIIPNQKKSWQRFQKKVYLSVYHMKRKRFIQLADRLVPDVRISENPECLIGFSDLPYRREMTWDGRYRDVFLVDIRSGKKTRVLTRHQHDVGLSPIGTTLVYYKDKNWYLYHHKKQERRCLSGGIGSPFSDEDHDYPEDVPGYGFAGWQEKGQAVFIYDKYDIWRFSLDGQKSHRITAGRGREQKLVFRLITLDPEEKHIRDNDFHLLSAYSDEEKYTGFYSLSGGFRDLRPVYVMKNKCEFLKKAKNAEKILFTRESYEEFPDIWISDLDFSSLRKLTDVNPQIQEFYWGQAELMEWRSMDGMRLQGVVIKPEHYTVGKRYPVLVYFYRFFSQRLFEFNQPVINHRPCFPFYTSHDYVIFLPDIRFDIGRPGYSATKCLVPGVQKLIDTGIANPGAIALHGHSWSGYQTAFVITQTNMFAAAIAGAPVANMTSAYSGIRWGSGLARQFQYEKSQSRIGVSLWQGLPLYIENSPVFFADRIQTPLLIQFGDQDEAVPWYQGIELYLAMRRLNKQCIFLQYRGEPHHLKIYANKLDYARRMKDFLDHFLKGYPAAEWIKTGVPYRK